MKALWKRFVRNEEGLELVEYAVMTALIVAVLVTAILLLSGAISNRFNTTAGRISAIT